MLFNSLEELISLFNGFKGQGMSFCCDVLPVIFYVSSEVVFSTDVPLFNDLVIATLMEFFIIKVGAIQCFQDSASFAAKLICSRYRFQTHLAALFAYDVVPIPVGGRKAGLICKLLHCIGKLLLDFVKPFWQAASLHLFVKEIKRA